MPVGATIGAAVVGAGATIGAGAMASNATKSAANTAADTQLQVSQQNNQLARDEAAAAQARLDPYSSMGLDAGDEYMGILLGHAPSHSTGTSPNGYVAYPAPTTTPSAGALSGYNGPSLDQIMAMQHDGIPGNFKSALAAYAAAQPSAATVQQHAQAAIAAGADPAAVAAHAAQYGVTL